ncbi:hypothetical protein GCM10011575_08280 [Microlunatus endophyticus]|uniref:DUF3618 domain-containing protein n=1 Tax=Microlunatus endophyticus TaxID=1716077 RepID=A0A917S262_9ACTN|nr:DUF3618 domain-containing protein [Microlunatus endophyticus]GGL52307.1 hypothetical protein GCM10011575_08280 [Microlunatus endophyticus]
MNEPDEPRNNPSAEDLEADIADARERLADDVAALADKADIPKQVRARIDQTRDNLGGTARKAQHQAQATTRSLPGPVRVAIPAAAALAVVLIIVGRRHRPRH